ncbi:PEP/pyruvate-binding domain-containing protein [Actinoplanes sp. G11-F43]|uniref:PEP/pyruvate-binding domain-containing protein n=1 Tax=Actinoplanes sp. G11-F43 TaxID=3424130 RepID=UPI003D33C69F
MRGGYVVDLYDLDRSQVAVAGGKGANLGELSRIDGVEVPAGFCVTTAAFQQGDITAAVAAAVGDGAYAVRSSATAEDLPTASFAGQQDSYLNVSGVDSIVEHVKKCWESLYTERAVAYRKRNGIDERSVRMAVVVQRMVAADVSGVLFTADPVSGDRRVSAVEAVAGLGEQLVSGRVNADHYRVRDGVISGEGTVLNPVQLRRLVDLGRRIEAHFGSPQDIEWCLAGDDLFIVQSRPITTLFPIPEVGDQDRHVYVSVGHQQMMTDAMKPLGHSMWRLTAMAPMHEAGGRLFVDIAARLADPAIRPGLLDMMGKGDPVIRDALETLLERDGVTPSRETMPVAPVPDPDPAIIERLIARSTASIEQLRHDISEKSGAELFDFLDDAFAEHKRVLADRDSFQALMAGMGATWWLNDRLAEWLGETNAADTLTLSAPGNITSEMGLELLDVADVIREHPEVETADVDDLPGEVREVLAAYLDRYGMRCVGEIDITRPRWSEQPGTLLPVLLDAVRNFRPGESRRRFEQGRERAAKYAADILVRLRSLRAIQNLVDTHECHVE